MFREDCLKGHTMIMALLRKGELSPGKIKSITKCKLMTKIYLLSKALDVRVTPPCILAKGAF